MLLNFRYKTDSATRLGLPAKPQINSNSLKGDDDYAELSSRFKGSAVKILVWWVAHETRKQADRFPDEPMIFNWVPVVCSRETQWIIFRTIISLYNFRSLEIQRVSHSNCTNPKKQPMIPLVDPLLGTCLMFKTTPFSPSKLRVIFDWVPPSCSTVAHSQDRIVNILAICAYHLQRCTEIQDNAGLVLTTTEADEASNSLQVH